jgi:polyhydroxybutyrate depolymerase
MRRYLVGFLGLAAAAAAVAVVQLPGSAQADDVGTSSTACGSPQDPGRIELTVDDRPYTVYVPRGYTGDTPVPLLFTLHGTAGNGPGHLTGTGLEATADANGFVVAAPTGGVPSLAGGFAWHVPGVPQSDGQPEDPAWPDDVAYLSRVIDTTADALCIDTTKVYSTGFSNGGRMSSALGCDLSDRIAAIAPVSGLRAGVPGDDNLPDPTTCQPTRPMRVVAFHGDADTVSPYGGDVNKPYWVYSVPDAQAVWSDLSNCQVGPVEVADVPGVHRLVSRKCAEQAKSEVYVLEGKGHEWPNVEGFDANQVMWDTLSQYSLDD